MRAKVRIVKRFVQEKDKDILRSNILKRSLRVARTIDSSPKG